MLTGITSLPIFFLIWTFFTTLSTNSLTRLGKTRSFEILKKAPARFFYLPWHRLLFKNENFELIIFTSTLAENLGRIGYIITAMFLIFSLNLTLIGSIIIGISLLVILLLIGDCIPRFWTLRAPERSLLFSAAYASIFLYLAFPISFVFLKLTDITTRRREKVMGKDPLEAMKETIVEILRECNVKGKLNASDKMLIESVIKFKDRIVREVMVPRVDLFTLDAETKIREAAKILIEEGYSRTPVYRETVDNIAGVLMFKDILELYMDCMEGKKDASILDQPIETILKGVFYTPETKKVSHLLQEFRSKQMHMAIVVDEYGGTEGVVTIEDILEEIVGDISDEYDIDEETLYVTEPGGGSWIVDARMSIFDAEDEFNITIPQEGDYDTIGGYIFHNVGSIPHPGLRIHHEDFDFEIISSTDRSVEKVRITPRHKEEEST